MLCYVVFVCFVFGVMLLLFDVWVLLLNIFGATNSFVSAFKIVNVSSKTLNIVLIIFSVFLFICFCMNGNVVKFFMLFCINLCLSICV